MVHHTPSQTTVVNNSLQLTAIHHHQITKVRGIDAAWAEANCRSVSTDIASAMLGYPAKSEGIMLVDSRTQFQFRPDCPWASKDGKKPKYRTPVGEYDAFLPEHPTDKGYWDVGQLKQACWKINGHPYLLVTEGGFKAISGCSNGLPTIGLMGVSMGLTPKDTQGKRCLIPELEKLAKSGIGLITVFDADAKTNKSVRREEEKLTKELLRFNVPVLSITGLWNIEDGKGMDDFIQDKGIEEFRRILAKAYALESHEDNSNEKIIPDTSHAHTGEKSDYIPATVPPAEDNFILKAQVALYSDCHWVSICGRLYKFTGSQYEEVNEPVEQRRISEWLATYTENVKGRWMKNRATPGCVNEVYNWIVKQVAIDSDKVNLDGLNCSSGVVRINPDGSHSFVPHNPSQVYTYVGCKYDPDIDATDCDRLLECLAPAQREIFLRTAAAALNLPLVRSKLGGRAVKGLLCQGEGSNGKDTLRAALAAVFGRGMTGKSLSDFKAYDGGRKFALSRLEGGICNWASENAPNINLDSLQSLKQFITGDPLEIERKGKDSYEYKPVATFFANCNKLPSITGGVSAIDDRYGILSFDKTYKRRAITSQGELEADPRFKDDENFILDKIAPALLNKMLERMPLLLAEGIDYDATREVMQEAQEKTNHLWQFANDAGVKVQPDGRIYIKDIWQKMRDWYQENGILEIECDSKGKEKLIWNDLPNKYDKPVKAINQVYARLCEIFPKLDKHRYNEREDMERKGQWYLSGIEFLQNSEIGTETAEPPSPLDTERLAGSPLAEPQATGEAIGKATTLTQSNGEGGSAVLSPFTEICNSISQLTDVERKQLAEILTQPQPEQPTPPTQPKTVTLKKGLRVRYVGDNANCVAQYGKLDLVVDDINRHHQVACLKPDGSFTTWLNSFDLRAISD